MFELALFIHVNLSIVEELILLMSYPDNLQFGIYYQILFENQGCLFRYEAIQKEGYL